jgi:thiol-disulfide isomerase/thioredoxin
MVEFDPVEKSQTKGGIMVNFFQMERDGIPFNNADSRHVVSGGDYEAGRIAAKRKQNNPQCINKPSASSDEDRLCQCRPPLYLWGGSHCGKCYKEIPILKQDERELGA